MNRSCSLLLSLFTEDCARLHSCTQSSLCSYSSIYSIQLFIPYKYKYIWIMSLKRPLMMDLGMYCLKMSGDNCDDPICDDLIIK